MSSPPVPTRTGRLAGVGLRPSGTQPTSSSQSNPSDSRPASQRRPRIPPVPTSLLTCPALQASISALPSNYSFEIPKTVHRIRTLNSRRVALQLPEGLLLYASVLADIFREHCDGAETVVLGDVTFGACCVDDLSANALGADLLVHYGHSCLVPVQKCVLPMLYVFVHIAFDARHLLRCLKDNFPLPRQELGPGDGESGQGKLDGAQMKAGDVSVLKPQQALRSPRIALLGTIQFVDTLHAIREEVSAHFGASNVLIPQARPLSPGELLGCTSPRFENGAVDAMVYVADGRFHLEAAMIANPTLPAYRYDPYSKKFSRERYAYEEMREVRRRAVLAAKDAQRFVVILGTLGRQGSPAILRRVLNVLREAGKAVVVMLLSEISPEKIRRMERAHVVDAWVQVACPRLSIDWGEGFGDKPVLTSYEAFVAVGKEVWREQYPMDYYARDGGQWSNYFREKSVKRENVVTA